MVASATLFQKDGKLYLAGDDGDEEVVIGALYQMGDGASFIVQDTPSLQATVLYGQQKLFEYPLLQKRAAVLYPYAACQIDHNDNAHRQLMQTVEERLRPWLQVHANHAVFLRVSVLARSFAAWPVEVTTNRQYLTEGEWISISRGRQILREGSGGYFIQLGWQNVGRGKRRLNHIHVVVQEGGSLAGLPAHLDWVKIGY